MKNFWLILTMAVGLGALASTSFESGGILFLFFLGFCLWFFKGKRKGKYLIGLVVFLLISLYCQFQYQELISYEKEPRISGSGIVSDITPDYVLINYAHVDGYSLRKRLRLYTEEEFHVGDRVAFRGGHIKREESMNPGGFNTYLYDLSTGIDMRVKGNKVIVLDQPSNLYGLKGIILESIRDIYKHNLLPDHEELVSAMVLGQGIGEETYESFQNLGLVHILSISGLHIGVLLLFIDKVFQWIQVSLYKKKLLKYLIIFFYLFLVGFPIGAVRVYLMVLVLEWGKLSERSVRSVDLFFFVASLFLLFRPFLIFHFGFLFSFMSVLGILTIYPVLSSKLPIHNKYLRQGLGLTLSVNIMILPLLLLLQARVNLLSLFLNLFYVPIFSLVLILSFLLGLLGGIVPIFGLFFGLSLDGLLGLSLEGLKLALDFPLNLFLAPLNVLEMGFYYFLIYFSVKGYYKDFFPKWARMIIVQALVSMVFLGSLFFLDRPDGRIHNIYVGQGDACLIEIKGYTAMIDTGGSSFGGDPGSKYTLSYLRSKGIRKIDSLLVSHFDADHIQGIFSLYPEIEFGEILSTYRPEKNEIYDKISREISPIRQVKEGRLKKGPVKLELFQPGEISSDENANSMVVLLKYGDFAMAFMGDLPVEREEVVGSKLGQVDVIKLGHHGSNTSTGEKLLDQLRPKLGIVSAGRENSYGHPHKEVLDRLEERKIRVLRTDRDGTITLTLKKNQVWMNTYLPRERFTTRDIVLVSFYLFLYSYIYRILRWQINLGVENGYNRIV